MEGFESEKEDFELNALRDREPVDILEDRGDVVSGAGLGAKTCGSFLGVLEFIEEFGG